ncbi:ABC transporter ATP-binding protein [Streptomyces iconiensis]|uniref:ABC transporter ATP-binding protein n=1 Tax=Streptomyces iconiensis TaxID=1384038 RepID=A0ABT7A0M7_9ACTN|nr:ABC transporter ATP-binding protein [Streptomyces iconiensis]MDJ1134875.1 ABC transporter ATP-binding protein [Streptomyces iconiensis]
MTPDTTRTAERSSVRSLMRLWPYVRPVRVRLFTAAFVAILASCLGLVIPLILKWIVDGPVARKDTDGVWLGGALLLAVGLTEALLFGLRRWLVARPLAGVEASMRAALYGRLQRLPVSFHDRWPSGQLLSRGTTDLQLLRMFLAFPLTFLLVNGTTVLVGCVILLLQEWTLGLVLLAPVLPLVLLCSVFEVRYALAARGAQDQLGDLTTVTEEAVLGVRVIKGFGRNRSQARAFRALSERLLHTELRKARLLAGIWALIMTLPEVAIGAALVLGTLQVADGGLSAGTLVAFLSTALALRWPVESIGFLLAMSNEAATATDRFFDVMDEPVPADVPRGDQDADVARLGKDAGGADVPRPGKGPGGGGRPRGEAESGLCFEGVVFRYPDAPPDAAPTLDGVNLRIRSGETMALVGATGSGKTTLTALVPRLHEVTEGHIVLDGTDVGALPRAELRERVAVAFEEPTLFSATVRENVLMGTAKSEAEDRAAADGAADGPADGPTDGLLERALRVAQADGFVGALPRGAETEVGEQGLSLSGGQRQRLALARAVVGRPRFLVLDDPLSALDVHTEAAVEAALREVLATTTALIVAHRPSTVLLADRVALLSGGKVTAVGTHHELLHSNAEYAELMAGADDPDSTGAVNGTDGTDSTGAMNGTDSTGGTDTPEGTGATDGTDGTGRTDEGTGHTGGSGRHAEGSTA